MKTDFRHEVDKKCFFAKYHCECKERTGTETFCWSKVLPVDQAHQAMIAPPPPSLKLTWQSIGGKHSSARANSVSPSATQESSKSKNKYPRLRTQQGDPVIASIEVITGSLDYYALGHLFGT